MNGKLAVFLTPLAICLGIGGLVLLAISFIKPKPSESIQQQDQANLAQQPVQQVQQQPVQQVQQQNQNQQPAPAAQIQPQLREVTAKEIEVFKSELRGIPAQMTGKFKAVSQTWVNISFGSKSNWIGFNIDDKNGNFFQYAIADKQKFSGILLNLKRNSPITLIGKVENYAGTTFFEVQEIQ